MPFGDVAGNVLIIDDEEGVCKLYKYALERAGIGAHYVQNARDAREALVEGSYALALIDVTLGAPMDRLDDDRGVKLADELRAKYPLLGFLMITGKTVGRDVASRYPILEKPASPHVIVERVMSQLSMLWMRNTLIALDERVATFTVSNMINAFLDKPAGKMMCGIFSLIISYFVWRGEGLVARLDTVEKVTIEQSVWLKQLVKGK